MIRHVLARINFAKDQSKCEEDPNFTEMMRFRQSILIAALDRAAAVTEDFSAIDRQLLYAAESWSCAVREGCYRTAIWSMEALDEGIRSLRTDIPPDKADQAGEIMEKRLEKAKLYTELIRIGNAADRAEHRIKVLRTQIEGDNCVGRLR